MEKTIRAILCILIVGTIIFVVAGPSILNATKINLSKDANGNQAVTSPPTKNHAAKVDLVPLTGTASAPTPYNIVSGSVYTTVMLRSLQTYEFPFVLNSEGVFNKVTRVDLWFFSQDCYLCADRIDFSYTVNGVGASASMVFPGTSTQGPVTHTLALPSEVASGINDGLNELTLDLTQATILSTGTVLTDFPFGVYEVALFIQYQTMA